MIRCSRTFYLVFLCARDGLPNTSNLHRTTATNFPRKLYSQQGIDEDTQSEVARVEKHSIKFLHAVNDLGTVIIVTNASLRWVEDAIEYMPDMRSLLDQYGIEVVSARDDCKRTNPFMYYYNLISPTGWKRRTFCAEVRKYLEANDYEDCDPEPDDFRVLCVGDSEQETSAALQLEFYNPCVDKDCLRILKLEEHPGIGTMCHQLFHLARCAEKFVKEEEFQEVRLVIYQNC